MIVFLAGCNLFYPTQIGFQNATGSYTFLEIKIGPVDYTTTLSPGGSTGFFGIPAGTYTLYTRGSNGILFSWPVQQSIASGYTYTLVFFLNNTSINYSTNISMTK